MSKVQITYKKKGIRITQIWYDDNNYENLKTDIVFTHGVLEKKDTKKIYQVFHTLISDLNQEEDSLYSLIQKNVKYEIRRNQKEAVAYKIYLAEELLSALEVLEQFADTYKNMYAEKGISQTLNLEQLKLYAKENALIITTMQMGDKPIVYHSYIVGEKDVRLLHSVSEFRREDMDANFVARCNKRLHWEDMVYFKKHGKETYDWGGVSNLEKPNGIDAFKFKFGGRPCTYYNQYEAHSFIGKVVLKIMSLKVGTSK